MTGQGADTVLQLMNDLRAGSKEAANQLTELLYPELRRLAAAKMRSERAEHSWQPTLLVNELYLELLKIKGLRPEEQQDRDAKQAFMGLAAFLMKRLLIHHARPASARAQRVAVEDGPDFQASGPETLSHVEHLLDRLAEVDPKFRTVVEMRVFEGATGEEIAARLGCSRKTAGIYWDFARKWLQQEMTGAHGHA
ncbi:MAG: ECF-type sigma factor [Bryobacteraceae bacterium]